MVDAELVAILVCPENKTPVKLVDEATIARVNAAIGAGTAKYRNGETVAEPIEGGLLREDGQYLYAIREDIPVMLIDEGIVMGQIS